MSTLVVVGYDQEFQAEEVRLKLRKMQKDYLISLEDAVVAVKDKKGKAKLNQAINLTRGRRDERHQGLSHAGYRVARGCFLEVILS